MDNKVKIIKEIVKFHPGLGADIGYSWYRGGLGDTGDWYWEKMIDEPIERLESFLEQLVEGKKQGDLQREADKRLREELGEEAYFKKVQKDNEDAIREHFREEERFLMWGKEEIKKESS